MALVRKPRTAAVAPTPLDVRLTNTLAAVVFAAALLVLTWAALKWATRSPVFTLRGITLEAAPPAGFQRTNVASVRANALPRLKGNFFSIDLDAARAAFESVPWVRRATVRRVWPNQLAVELEEHQPAALWQGDSERRNERLVNTHGEVFEANLGDVEEDGLPVLTGPEGRADEMLSMARRLAPV